MKKYLGLLVVCCMVLLAGLPARAPAQDKGEENVPEWWGEFIGEKYVLRVGNFKNGGSFTYLFEDRTDANRTVEGMAGVMDKKPRAGGGEGLDFALAPDNSTVKVSAWKKAEKEWADRKALAGVYHRTAGLVLDKGKVRVVPGNKALPDSVPLRAVENAPQSFVAVGADLLEKYPNLRPGLYFFDPEKGDPVEASFFDCYVPEGERGLTPEDFGEAVTRASVGPSGHVIALGWFPDTRGDLYFFTWDGAVHPLAKPVVEAYSPDEKAPLVWVGANTVIINAINTDQGSRSCGYDPCGPVSVKMYDAASGVEKVILQGTDRCDYYVRSVENGVLTAARLCLSSPEAWKEYPTNVPMETVTVPFP